MSPTPFRAPISRTVLPVALSVLLAGCLPLSCNRTESRSLLPADSLSREFALASPVDTLVQRESPEMGPLEYPRTLEYGADGTLWVADSGDHTLHRLLADGTADSFDLDSLQYPYMAGFYGPDPVVFSPAISALAAIRDGKVVWQITTPSDPAKRALQYAVVQDSAIWVKLAARGFDSQLQRMGPDGEVLETYGLEEPFWRWAGALKMTNSGPISLSGYRPVVYFPAGGGRMDSVQLAGFDSPMLSRSNNFLTGEIDQPPLLSPSATWFEGKLYVLNIRPGWLQVDEFGGDFRLLRVLMEQHPEFGSDFYPTDLALHREANGRLTMALAVVKPRPEIRLYTVPNAR